MRGALLTIASLLILLASCNGQALGLYVGEIDLGVKHLSRSNIQLKNDNKFRQEYSMTSWGAKIPSRSISIIEGTFERADNKVILLPESMKVNWLVWGRNSDTVDFRPNGVRKSAMVVLDTCFGQMETIEEPELVRFNVAEEENSQYLWNNKSCFVRFRNTEVSNDLKNYCSDIRRKYNATTKN